MVKMRNNDETYENDEHDEHDGHGDGHDTEVWLSQTSLPKNMPKRRHIKNVYVKGSRDL